MTNTLERVVHRAATDEQFRAHLITAPEEAIAGYELTGPERIALTEMREQLAKQGGELYKARMGAMAWWA